MNIEMPDIEVFAEMEYTGVELCIPYADRLKVKYGKMLEAINDKIAIEFGKYYTTISS